MLKPDKLCLLRHPLRIWPHSVHQSGAAGRILNRHRRPLGYIDVSALKTRWEKGEINPVRRALATYHFQCKTFDIRRSSVVGLGTG